MPDPLTPIVLPLVLPNDDGLRASKPGECFYCAQKIGTSHLATCVCLNKKVKVRMTVEYEIEIPYSWDDAQIEFHRNEGSWCASNMFQELESVENELGCLCSITTYKVLETTNPGPYGKESSSTAQEIIIDEIGSPKRIN